MLQIIVLLSATGLSLSSPAPGYGHHGYHHPPPCVKELETIKVTSCKLVPEKTCATETVKIGEKITGFEKGDCKEIEVCKPVYGYRSHHGYHGKRSADAEPGYVHAPCEKVTKEICKSVPVKADVSKDIESCTEVAKEVCEEVEKVVPKVTCKTATIKH
eukprot:TRINITY_DN283_c0_g1_i6.p1 TRINITY_DN283_c0_g1~~TRINITY_DN283_c0_g1_i6.p1  ORF type:complete len:159 (-),score=58.75 TRINITY_DN283_c0_g1_i6:116-592(-)